MGKKADAAQAELDAYKLKVRTEAIEAAKKNSWCDPGLNEILAELDLPLKNPQRVPVDITFTQRKYVTVPDAVDRDGARAQIAEMTPEQVKELLESAAGLTITSFTVPDPEDDSTAALAVRAGDRTRDLPDGAYIQDSSAWCGRRNVSGYSCSMPQEHGGTRHVAANSSSVVGAWDETDVMQDRIASRAAGHRSF